MRRQAESGSAAQSIDPLQHTPPLQWPEPGTATPADTTESALTLQRPDAGDQTQQAQDAQPENKVATDRFSGPPPGQSAGQVPPASSSDPGELYFHDLIPNPAPAHWPPTQPDGIGPEQSEAEAARAVAAARLGHSVVHDKEGAATDLIPDLALTLATFAAPYAVAPLARLVPRVTERLLPKFLLPEYIMNSPIEREEVPNDAIVPFADAVAAAKEFLASTELPPSIEWFEL